MSSLDISIIRKEFGKRYGRYWERRGEGRVGLGGWMVRGFGSCVDCWVGELESW